jgi:hypothetical protein
MSAYQFPRWTSSLRPVIGFAAVVIPTYLVVLIATGLSAENLNVGYAPEQPIPFSHAKHAGELGIDCRYCHNTVENAAHAAIPQTATCLGCHDKIHTESKALEPLRAVAASGDPIEWVKVHDLAEFSYFNHSAHVSAGVSCVECHGRVDQMEVVRQDQPLSMGWCLDCHRDPAPRLRPQEFITDLDWGLDMSDSDRRIIGHEVMKKNNVNPRTDCSTCHR